MRLLLASAKSVSIFSSFSPGPHPAAICFCEVGCGAIDLSKFSKSFSACSQMEDGIYFDGAADPNPGPAGFGFSHRSHGSEVAFCCGFLGTQTNNVAEYHGLVQSLLYCKLNSLQRIRIFGDSQLVIKQVLGTYKVKSESLRKLCDLCRSLVSELDVSLHWIPREENQRADYLSKLPLLEREKDKSKERQFLII